MRPEIVCPSAFAVAGIGSRFLALSIDTLIQIAVLVAIIIVIAIPGVRGQPSVWVIASAGAGFFLLFYGYFAFFEILWNGQTPGERGIGIRVVKDSGRPLTAAESIGRNLLHFTQSAWPRRS